MARVAGGDVVADGWTDRVVATLQVGPTEEPITVDELKMRARHTRTDEDPLLAGYIAAARQQVERDTDHALLTQTWRAAIVGGGEVALPWPPLVAVLSVQQVAADGTVTPIDPADYWVDTLATPGRIVLPSSGRFLIDYTAGWPSPELVPPLLVQAVGLLASHYLTIGRDVTTVGTSIAETPYGYAEAVQAYRLVGVA